MATRGRFGTQFEATPGTGAGSKPSQAHRQSFAQRQAEARARYEAQRRRYQAEQQARIQEQKRRAQEARTRAAQEARKRAEQEARIREVQRKAANQKRQDSARQLAERQRREVVVKRGDTAEKLASRLGADAKTIAQQTKGALRAGQVRQYEVPADRLTRMEEADTVQPRVQNAANIATGGLFQSVVGQFTEWIGNAFGAVTTMPGSEQDIMNGYGQLGRGLRSSLNDIGEFHAGSEGMQMGGPSGAFADAFGGTAFSGPEDMYTYEEATPMSYNMSPEEMKAITDRTRDLEMKQTLQQTYADIKTHEDELYEKTIGLRAKTHAALYAWETGDFSVRPDFFTEWEWDQLADENKRRYQEDLGYVWDEVAGVWVPQDLEELGYGMGDYGYGDYGGYGGGGGDYVPPRYTGAQRGIRQDSRARVGADRLTSSYIPASHWRI